MNDVQRLEKQRTPRRFFVITALIYLPVFLALAIIHARWYGWLSVGLSFGLLLWMRSTRMWQGLRIALCFALALLVALSGLYAGRPQKDVSMVGQLGRELVRLLMRLPPDSSVRSGQAFSEASLWQAPEGYLCRVAMLSQSRLELFGPEAGEGSYALLQLHGGAFMSGMSDIYRIFAERYCGMLQGGVVATLDYRLWPDHSYPAQQEDTMEAWRYLTETLGYAADHIILAGDSAGGNLALSLTLRLRDEGKPLPGALVCMSPWADLSNSGSSHIFNATKDPTFGVPPAQYDGEPVGVDVPYADDLNAKDPYVSPSFGDYRGFPRMLLQVSSNEVLLSDSEMIAENARASGVDCTLTVYEDLFHVFQGTLDWMPESKAAWDEIEAFIGQGME